ncbi:MAG: proline racemase family protein [Desulfobacterales bacterium]|jgi:proline racemase
MLIKDRIEKEFRERYPDRIITIDSHIAGEPARLIVGGMDPLPGETMQNKREYFMAHYDHIRLLLTREPRGHRDMFAACVTEPVTPGARFGLIYMDARRYPYLCGHATMGAVMTMIEAGLIDPDDDDLEVIVDTPSGPMQATAYMHNGKVESVAIRMVPSFVHSDNETLSVPEIGQLTVATVCVGGFFVMVSTDQIGLDFSPSNRSRLKELGMQLIHEANQQLTVRHPTRPEVKTVDVTEFYDPSSDAQGKGKSMVILGEGHMDRSPCGTGTTAKMTLLHHRGQFGFGETFTNTSPLGTTFQGRLVEETRLGDTMAVVAEVRGSAYITGVHDFIIDPKDPFQEGFLL